LKSVEKPAREGGHARRLEWVWRDVVAIRPASGTAWTAGRAALSMLTPMILLAATGHLEWAVYATFGAFASVYGGGVRHAGRWRVQSALGVVMTSAVVCGALVALSPERRWLAIPVAAVWAALAAGLADAYHWRPNGPMLPVFAVAASSAVPSTPADLAAAAVLAAGTAAFAVVLGILDVAWHRYRRPPDAPEPVPPDPIDHPIHRRLVQATRCAAAVVIAGAAATGLGIGHPYWAMVTAVVPMSGHTYAEQLVRGIQRLAGTLVGLVAAGALLSLRLPAVGSILVIAGLQAAAEALVIRNYGLALLAITPLALLLGQLANPSATWPLIGDRLIETAIGVVVGLITVTATRARE
jgi:hypothetical protein